MLKAELLGGMRLYHPKHGDCSPRSRKSAAIIGYLLRSKHRVERRDRLAGLLWSESTDQQARDALRQCIMELRRIAERTNVPFLKADRQDIRLDPRHIRSDLDEMDDQLASDRGLEILDTRDRQDLVLLSGLEDVDPSFADWLAVERESWSQNCVQRLMMALRRPRARADRSEMLRLILRLDPYQESAVEVQMQDLAAEGNAVEAIRVFDAYAAALRREYQVTPDERISKYADHLRKRTDVNTHPRATASALAQAKSSPRAERKRPDIPTIALLPIEAGLNAQQHAMTEDLVNELFSALTRFKEWIVLTIATAELGLKATQPGDIARRLDEDGIEFVLLVKGQSGAQNASFTLQLIDCASGTMEISERYPAAASGWVEHANEITRRIAAKMHVVIPASRLRKVVHATDGKSAAYNHCVEGLRALRTWTVAGHQVARSHFEKALEIDENCSAAHANLASLLNSRWFMFPGIPATEQELRQALTYARRAVELDPLDSFYHLHLGWNHMIARRHAPSEFHFQAALDLNPYYPNVVIACAEANAFLGNYDLAQELSDRAFSMNPLPPPYFYGYHAFVTLLRRDFEGCIAAVAHAPDCFPNIMCLSAVSQVHLANIPAAVAARQQFYSDMRARWQGPPAPTDEALDAWMVNNLLTKRPEDRALIADGLARIRTYVGAGRFGNSRPSSTRG